MLDNQVVDSIENKQKTEQEKAQVFVTAYNELCQKHQLRLCMIPAFIPRDDGTWSIVVQTSVGKLPQQEELKG